MGVCRLDYRDGVWYLINDCLRFSRSGSDSGTSTAANQSGESDNQNTCGQPDARAAKGDSNATDRCCCPTARYRANTAANSRVASLGAFG